MRIYLQAEVRCKEAKKTYLSMKIKNAERHKNQPKAELEAIKEQVKEPNHKEDRDKDTLKAIRAQKERAKKSEEYAEQLHVQLADKVPVLPPSSTCCWRE